MQKQLVEFRNDRGDSLRGDLYRPMHEPRAFVLFAHCFTCASNWKAPVRIARALCRDGFAVLAFDFTGLGRSGGEFADTNFTTNVADLVAAARYLESGHGAGPAIVIGHSLGGAAALAAAESIPSCKAIVTIGAPSRASHVAHLLEGGRAEIEAKGEAQVDIGGRPFVIKKQLLMDLERHDVSRSLQTLGRAVLIMHSPTDAIVPIGDALELFERAEYPKSFVSLDGADHLLSRERDAQHAAGVLGAWARRYVGDVAEAVEGGIEAERDVAVARTGDVGFVTEIDAGGHELIADEPVGLGGSDLGPTPYELLAAALASCTSITLQLYARRKGIPLDLATVVVRHSRVHPVDCAACETSPAKIDRLDREVQLRGELDEPTRLRLLEIAERCPVHRTLEGAPEIRTMLLPERGALSS